MAKGAVGVVHGIGGHQVDSTCVLSGGEEASEHSLVRRRICSASVSKRHARARVCECECVGMFVAQSPMDWGPICQHSCIHTTKRTINQIEGWGRGVSVCAQGCIVIIETFVVRACRTHA